nr:immunoglobulin heavy chain junction region [Mus musculus]
CARESSGYPHAMDYW